MKAKLYITLLVVLVFVHSALPAQEKDTGQKIIIGEKIRMYSEILGEWRPLEIYLPDDYEISGKPYPVMLVLDGGWAFLYCVSIVDMMSPNYFPRMVVVGLPNTDRSRDLYPLYKVNDETEKGTANFLRFMHEELFPFLGKKFRIRDYRILFGHSLAGYFSIYTLLKYPSLFNGYIATSPSLRMTENKALLSSLLGSVSPDDINGKFLYFSGGGEEGEELHMGIKTFDLLLKEKKIPGLTWSYDIFDGEGHVPVKGFYKGLRGLFHRWIPVLEFFRSGTLDDIKSHYRGLTEKYGFPVLPPIPIVNVVGRRYLREGKSRQAVDVYRYYVSLYPAYSSGYLALAEAYILAKNQDSAVENLRKCLQLDPENSRAKKLLEDLQKKQ